MSNEPNKKILCLDVGTQTVGLARTDEMGLTTQPLATLRYKGIHHLGSVFDDLLKVLQEFAPKTIVIGQPFNMDGSVSPQMLKVQEFINAFKNHLKKHQYSVDNHEWIFWDERISSEEANDFLLKQDVSRKKRKDVLDKMAAVFILQRYLEENQNN